MLCGATKSIIVEEMSVIIAQEVRGLGQSLGESGKTGKETNKVGIISAACAY